MQLSRRAALNEAQLDEVDERILISGIQESPGELTATATPILDGEGGGMGSRVAGVQRSGKKIRVLFRLRVRKTEQAARAQLIDAVNTWAAGGGILTIGSRPEQRMRVRCSQEAEAGDMRDWTREYALTFEANESPYWENIAETSATGPNNRSGSFELQVPGNLPNVLDLNVRNVSGALINKMTVSAGGYSFKFTELGLAANEELIADHTSRRIIRIRIRNAAGSYRSVLIRRTDESDDELRVKPGAVTVSYTADRAVSVTARCRGRFA